MSSFFNKFRYKYKAVGISSSVFLAFVTLVGLVVCDELPGSVMEVAFVLLILHINIWLFSYNKDMITPLGVECKDKWPDGPSICSWAIFSFSFFVHLLLSLFLIFNF